MEQYGTIQSLRSKSKIYYWRDFHWYVFKVKCVAAYVDVLLTISNTAGSDNDEAKGRGWSSEGILRFNELVAEVKKDRESEPGWWPRFLKYAKERNVVRKKRRITFASEVPEAAHELFDEDSEPEDNGRLVDVVPVPI